MVKEVDENFQCEECGLEYEENEQAEKCEQWCKEHESCNLEITRHVVNKNSNSIRNKLREVAEAGGVTGAVASGILGFFGVMGLCCSPLVLAFLGLFGISSGMFLMTYKWWFLGLSIALFISVVVFWHKGGKK